MASGTVPYTLRSDQPSRPRSHKNSAEVGPMSSLDTASMTEEASSGREIEQVELQEKPAGPPPSPDGGVMAWLQCAAGFCIFFNTWGLLNTYGAFQTYYQQDLLKTSSASDISWIGTLQASFIMLGAVYSGPLYDWGYLRPLIFVGCFMLTLGMFMTSLCHDFWQVLLAQGLFIGIGLGCLFTPTTGVIVSYFTKRRGLAMGIASSGTTIGGVVYPAIFNNLVHGKLGFGWTTRVLAFIMLFLSIPPVLGLRMRTKPPAVRKIFNRAAWKEPEFSLYAISWFVGYMGMYVPYFYVQLYCVDLSIISGRLLLYLLPILNASGFFGRIFFGYLADRIGPMNSFALAGGACGVLLFGWMGITGEVGILVFCILYGFATAGLIMLPATIVATALCPDMRQFGVRITMQLVPSAIGLLIGNPIAGAVLRKGWLSLQGFSAALVVGCTLLSIAARIAKAGWRVNIKC